MPNTNILVYWYKSYICNLSWYNCVTLPRTLLAIEAEVKGAARNDPSATNKGCVT